MILYHRCSPHSTWLCSFLTLVFPREDFWFSSREFHCFFNLPVSPSGTTANSNHVSISSHAFPSFLPQILLSFMLIYIALCSDPHMEYFHFCCFAYFKISDPVWWLSRQRLSLWVQSWKTGRKDLIPTPTPLHLHAKEHMHLHTIIGNELNGQGDVLLTRHYHFISF